MPCQVFSHYNGYNLNAFLGIWSSSDDIKRTIRKSPGAHRDPKSRKKTMSKRRDERARSPQNSTNPYDADESDSEELPGGYHQVSIQVKKLSSLCNIRRNLERYDEIKLM